MKDKSFQEYEEIKKKAAIMKVLKELFFITCQDHVDRLDDAVEKIVNITMRAKH